MEDIRSFFTSNTSKDKSDTLKNKNKSKPNKNEQQQQQDQKKDSRRHKVIIDSDDEEEPVVVAKKKSPVKKRSRRMRRIIEDDEPKVEMSAEEFFSSSTDTIKEKSKECVTKKNKQDAMDLDAWAPDGDEEDVDELEFQSDNNEEEDDDVIPEFTQIETQKPKAEPLPKPKKKAPRWYPGKQRGAPPLLGQKDIPIGKPGCLDKLRFVVTGTLESMEREDAEDLIKRYGGRVTKAISKLTDYLVRGEDPGPSKVAKAGQYGTRIIDEDGLFDIIRASNPSQKPMEKKPKKKAPPKKKKSKPQSKKSSADNVEGLWVEKYRPKTIGQIIGNATNVKKLIGFLRNWETVKRSGKMKQYAALLSGPPGIGKTTAAYIAAQNCDLEVLEFNASDTRNKKAIANVTSTAGDNYGIRFFCEGAEESHEKRVIIMDEVDGMSAGDRGGMAALIAFLKKSRVPVICICNDRSSPKVRSLVNHCLDLRFRRPTARQVATKLLPLLESEGFQMDMPSLEKLVESCRSDIRQVLNTVQMWSTNIGEMSFDDVKENLKTVKKDLTLNVFDVIPHFFRRPSNDRWFDERTGYYFVDFNIIPLFVQEKYLQSQDNVSDLKSLERFAEAAECISDSDILNSHLRSNQSFKLLPVHAALSSIIPGRYVEGIGGRGMVQFPQWLGKNSSRRKKYRLMTELKSHMSRKISGDGLAVLLDYLPVLEAKLSVPLVTQGKEGVPEVIDVLKDYGLDLVDKASISEFIDFYQSSHIRKSIPPKVKAHLTRTFKKEVHVVTKKRKRASDGISNSSMKEENDDAALERAGADSDHEKSDDGTDSLIVKKKAKKTRKTKTKKSKAATRKRRKK